jgi:hypothetical protein
MKLNTLLSLSALALLATAARSQEATRAPAPERSGAVPARTEVHAVPPADFSDVSSEELPAVRQAVTDESLHRDRLARIKRLRELAAESRDRARMDQLDELERREGQIHDAARIRSHAAVSDATWERIEKFLQSGGVARARMANADQQAQRARAANHQAERERAAQAGAQRQPTRSAAPSRPAGTRSGGGRGPR